jgi:hypothetical protein
MANSNALLYFGLQVRVQFWGDQCRGGVYLGHSRVVLLFDVACPERQRRETVVRGCLLGCWLYSSHFLKSNFGTPKVKSGLM